MPGRISPAGRALWFFYHSTLSDDQAPAAGKAAAKSCGVLSRGPVPTPLRNGGSAAAGKAAAKSCGVSSRDPVPTPLRNGGSAAAGKAAAKSCGASSRGPVPTPLCNGGSAAAGGGTSAVQARLAIWGAMPCVPGVAAFAISGYRAQLPCQPGSALPAVGPDDQAPASSPSGAQGNPYSVTTESALEWQYGHKGEESASPFTGSQRILYAQGRDLARIAQAHSAWAVRGVISSIRGRIVATQNSAGDKRKLKKVCASMERAILQARGKLRALEREALANACRRRQLQLRVQEQQRLERARQEEVRRRRGREYGRIRAGEVVDTGCMALPGSGFAPLSAIFPPASGPAPALPAAGLTPATPISSVCAPAGGAVPASFSLTV